MRMQPAAAARPVARRSTIGHLRWRQCPGRQRITAGFSTCSEITSACAPGRLLRHVTRRVPDSLPNHGRCAALRERPPAGDAIWSLLAGIARGPALEWISARSASRQRKDVGMSFDLSSLFWVLLVVIALQPLLTGRWYTMRRVQAIRAIERAHGAR